MLQISKTCADMQLLPRVCFCFLTLSGLTFGDRSGPPATRVTVKEDDDVVLPCSLGTSVNIESELFDWRKEGTVPRKEVFMYDPDSPDTLYRGQDEQFKGRVSHFPGELKQGNASIRITKARLEDKGNYTCIFPRTQPSQKVFTIELVVGAAPEPYVTMLKDKGQLQCKVPGASPKPTVEWWDSDNKTLPSKMLQDRENQGRFYIIVQTIATKPGCYHCVATQMDIFHQISSEICVHDGAASKPTIITLDETKDGVQLSCEVQGASPKPKVVWKDSSGNILPAKIPQVTERGDSYDIILQITVTKTDHYRCEVIQEEINHLIHTETYVPVHEFPVGWVVAAIVLGALLVGGVVLLVVLKAKGFTCKKDSLEATNLSSNDSQHLNHNPNQPLNE